MRPPPRPGWHSVRERLRLTMQRTVWRRRLIIAAVIVGAQAAALVVTYRAVVFQNRTLLTGAGLPGAEGVAPPYGYPGPASRGYNEVDAGASAWQFVPQIRKAHAELFNGEIPLWSANVMLGAPLAADPIHGLFNPLTWPLVASPSNVIWDLWLLARLLLAGVLCSALALYLGLQPPAATIAGLVYMMSGTFQLRTTTIQTGVMAVLPLLVLALEYCLRKPSRRSTGTLAAAIALTLLFGMPEEGFVCLAFGALYFVVRLGAEWRRTRRPPSHAVVDSVLGGGVIGLLWGLPQMLPFGEYLGLGTTTHSPGVPNALSVEDAGQLLRLVGPHWTGAGPLYQVGFSPFDNWFGIGAIFLAMLGVFTRSLPRGVRTLLALTTILVEAKLVGLPGWLNQFVGTLPIVRQITLAAYAGVLVSLALALLAGAGLQRVAGRSVNGRDIAGTGLILAVVVTAAAPTFLAGKTVTWSGVALTGAVLLLTAVGAWLAVRPRRSRHLLGILVTAGGVTAELIALATPAIPLPTRYDPLSSTPTTAYLQRVMPSGSGRSYSATQILYPSTNQAFNLDDIRNLDAIYVERTYHYLKLFVAPGLYDRFDGLGVAAAHFIRNPFFNALNVRYVLVAPPITSATAPPPDQFTLETIAADGIAIYRNHDAAPRAQVIFDVARAISEQNAATIMSSPGFDPARRAVVEAGRTSPSSNRAPMPARVLSYSDNSVVIATTTTQAGTLVLADAFYPGWEAHIDGSSAAIYPVDIALRGVTVPAGVHTVTMQYSPRSVEAGALGVPAGLVVFGAGGWVIPAVRHARRRPAASHVQ